MGLVVKKHCGYCLILPVFSYIHWWVFCKMTLISYGLVQRALVQNISPQLESLFIYLREFNFSYYFEEVYVRGLERSMNFWNLQFHSSCIMKNIQVRLKLCIQCIVIQFILKRTSSTIQVAYAPHSC